MEDTLLTQELLSHVIMDTTEMDLAQELVNLLNIGISKLQHAIKVIEMIYIFLLSES